jgi:hypothetical protein
VSHRNGESAQNRKLSWSPDVSLDAFDEVRFPLQTRWRHQKWKDFLYTSPRIYQIEQVNFNSYSKLVINQM